MAGAFSGSPPGSFRNNPDGSLRGTSQHPHWKRTEPVLANLGHCYCCRCCCHPCYYLKIPEQMLKRGHA